MLLAMTLLGCDRDKADSSAVSTDTSGGETSGSTTGGGTITEPAAGCDADRVLLDGARCAAEAPCAWEGALSGDLYGYAVAAGRDLDGDGRDDLAIGAPQADGDDTESGTVTLLMAPLDGGEGIVLSGAAAGDYAGTDVRMIDDVTGDGLPELMIGARGADTGGANSGAVLLVAGSVSPTITATWSGERDSARVGWAAGVTGDVDGDGVVELIVSGELAVLDGDDEDPGPGRVYLLSDAAAGGTLADADVAFDGSGSERAGWSLAIADLNGDGYADPIAGAPYGSSYQGAVHVVPGGAEQTGGALADVALTLSGSASSDAFGWTVAAGDLTGDGLADLAVGAPLSDAAWENAGEVTLHAGGSGFFDEGGPAIGGVRGELDDHQLGTGLDASGDIDGDGTRDLLMGAVTAWTGIRTKSGRAYLWMGGGTWTEGASAAAAHGVLHGGDADDYLGRSITTLDIDVDGFDDVLVGAGFADRGGSSDVGAAVLFFGG